MNITFDVPTIYVSHSIRGDGTKTMEENCKYACRVADKIERIFPEIGLYCPARSDLSLQVLWDAKKITVDDIMFADLKILAACSGWMWIYTGPSDGSCKEWVEAVSLNLSTDKGRFSENKTIIRQDLLKANYHVTRRILEPIVSSAITRFRKGN